METNGSNRLADEIRGLLDALASADDDARRSAATGLARLGVWSRGNTLPRGSIWAAPPVALPFPERLDELRKAAHQPDPAIQSQAIAALGHWGDESIVPTIVALLRSSSDETLRLYCLAALGTVGGPVAAAALIEAASDASRSVALAALQGLEALLTGGHTDDTIAPSFIRQPPPDLEVQFASSVSAIARALEGLGKDKARRAIHGRARDLLDLIARKPMARRVVHLTPDRLNAFLAELEHVPATPVAGHLRPDDIVACATEELGETELPKFEAHLASCGDCAAAVEDLMSTLVPWQGAAGDQRLVALAARIRATGERAASAAPAWAALTPAAVIASFAARVQQVAMEMRGEFAASLRAQFEQLRTLAGATAVYDPALVLLALGAAAVPMAAADRDQRRDDEKKEDKTLQGRVQIDENRSLVVLLASRDLEIEGLRVAVTIGDLRAECVLERVAKDQVLGEVKFPRDAWSALPANPEVAVDVLDPAIAPDKE